MFLKDLSLKNFKNLEDIKLSFQVGESDIRKWTFILGENGTGKSNILKAIGLITAGSDAIGELLNEPDEWITNDKEYCEIKATLINAEKEDRNISLTIQRGEDLRKLLSRSFETLEEIDKALEYTNRNYFIVGYGANRKLANASRSRSLKHYFRSHRSNSVATLFHKEASLRSLEEWATNLDYTNDVHGLEIIKTTLDNFLPDIKFSHIVKKERVLFFKTADGIIPLDQLSEGFQNMATWIGDILYQLTNVFKNYSNPLEAKGVLLIDELALHLHPKWQKKLIRLLGNILPNFQIICTTHSPMTAQQAGLGELHLLKRNNEKKITLVPYFGNPAYMPISELLTSNAFGMNSDESLEIETHKKRYKVLKKKKKLNKDEKLELTNISDFLIAKPLVAQNEREKKQIALLEKLMKNKK